MIGLGAIAAAKPTAEPVSEPSAGESSFFPETDSKKDMPPPPSVRQATGCTRLSACATGPNATRAPAGRLTYFPLQALAAYVRAVELQLGAGQAA